MEGRALADHARADQGAADTTRFARAAVDRELLFEIAGRAVRADEVAQGRPAAADRVGEDALHFRRETRVALARDAACRASGMDARREQRLARVDVADADDDALVHEEQL